MDRIIYMDNAATTATRPEAVQAMLPFFTEDYGNPGGIYSLGQKTKDAVDGARKTIARTLGAKPEEIYFTAGGTESDNWAIKAAAEAFSKKGRHIITSKIEHHAVLHTCQWLEKQGFEVTCLDVDKNGIVDPKSVEAAIRPDTILISIMYANNEIGTLEPISKIGEIAKKHGIPFHTDAVQAFAHVPINVDEENIDMLSASGHKFGGPKGVGFLYVRTGIRIRSFIHGGAQERKRRAGTENVPGIVGMAKACEVALENIKEKNERLSAVRDHLISRVMAEIPHAILNGDKKHRLPSNANFCFRFVEGESLLMMLDMAGICASSGSACTSGSLDPSHVLLAIGLPHEIAHGSLRLTISGETTMEDVDYTVGELKKIVEKLRAMSPLYEDFVKKGQQ